MPDRGEPPILLIIITFSMGKNMPLKKSCKPQQSKKIFDSQHWKPFFSISYWGWGLSWTWTQVYLSSFWLASPSQVPRPTFKSVGEPDYASPHPEISISCIQDVHFYHHGATMLHPCSTIMWQQKPWLMAHFKMPPGRWSFYWYFDFDHLTTQITERQGRANCDPRKDDHHLLLNVHGLRWPSNAFTHKMGECSICMSHVSKS